MPPQRHFVRKGRPRQPIPKTLPVDLYAYADDPEPRRSPRRASALHVFDVERLPVIDDWPEKVPITDAEIDVFERWFADVFNEMFGPPGSSEGLIKLSPDDNNKP